ncbi:MAG TPA: PilZ domain-containing protein [Thermodesulfobacteriota bacterium]
MLRLLLADAGLAETVARGRLFRNQPNARIVSARNRAELLSAARRERPQLIAVDADFYRSQIDDLIRTLRREPVLRSVPIIVTTAKWRESLQELLLGAGANALLVKPVPVQQIYDLVRAAGPAMALDVRVPVGAEATFLVGGRERRGRIVNVSRGGLYLECDAPPAVGTPVRVTLSLPAFTNVAQVDGVVTWTNDGRTASVSHVPRGVGVRFVDAPLVARKMIALYVSMSKTVVRVT